MLRDVALNVSGDFGLEVARIAAEIAAKSLDLNVHHFLMFREIFDENSALRALLPRLRFGALLEGLRFSGVVVVLQAVAFKST